MTDNQFERLVLVLERIAKVLEGPPPKSLWETLTLEERASLATQNRVAFQGQFPQRKST